MLSVSEALAEHVPFLNNLNEVLHQVEKDLISRAETMIIHAEKKLDAIVHFSSDYEVEATIEYYLGADEEPAHSSWFSFTYEDVVLKKDYGMLLDNGSGSDWHRESYMPPLDKPYCYLLHDLIDHSRPRLHSSLSTLTSIWVDMVYNDQQHFRIGKEGSGVVVRWGERK